MSIHYATGTATTAHQILAAIRGFMVTTLGWNEDHWSSDGNISRFHCHLGSDQHASWDCRTNTDRWATTPRIGLFRCTGYDSELAWDAQPGSHVYVSSPDSPSYCLANGLLDGSMAYWLFGGTGADGDYCHAVIERLPAQYVSIHCGELKKICTFTGGSFCDCANVQFLDDEPSGLHSQSDHFPFGRGMCIWNGAKHGGWIRADLDGAAAPNWQSFQDVKTPLAANTSNTHCSAWAIVDRFVVDIGSSALNMQSVLWPISVYAVRPEDYYSAIGDIPGVRKVDLEYIAPQQTLDHGSEVWMAFPALSRTSSPPSWLLGPVRTSGFFGYAYRRA